MPSNNHALSIASKNAAFEIKQMIDRYAENAEAITEQTFAAIIYKHYRIQKEL